MICVVLLNLTVDLSNMRPLFEFIVKVPKLFEDTISVNGVELYKDTRFDDFKGRISYGEITAVPEKYDTPARVGDTLIFHHHVCQETDKYGIGDDHYMVTYDPNERSCHAFGVIKPSGEIITLANWVFLEAPEEKSEEETSESGLFLGIIEPDTTNTEGVVKAKNHSITDIEVGDTVGFRDNADYRIRLPEPHGDIFRMSINDIYYVKG